jgi:putative transcriptional regulator
MIRFRLKELIAEKEFRERRVITMTEVAAQTGINRMTLSKIANHPGYSTVTDNLDRLCDYFGVDSSNSPSTFRTKASRQGEGAVK